MKCTYCGEAELDEGDNYCSTCGASLTMRSRDYPTKSFCIADPPRDPLSMERFIIDVAKELSDATNQLLKASPDIRIEEIQVRWYNLFNAKSNPDGTIGNFSVRAKGLKR